MEYFLKVVSGWTEWGEATFYAVKAAKQVYYNYTLHRHISRWLVFLLEDLICSFITAPLRMQSFK